MIGLRFSIRRDALVASITQPSIVYPVSTGTTSVPLQFLVLEGRASRLRRATFDYPSRFDGHNRRAPPSCSVTLTTNLTRARIPIQNPGVLVRTLYRRW